MSRISIIVPIYNVEKYIHRCIDSIIAQTFTDFELILVDDGSPDNCGKICDEYAEKDSRIRVIHKGNGGLSDARNAGIDWAFENSNSEWLTFIDSDDWVHPKYLEALYYAVEETGCSLSVCGFEKTEGEEPIVDDTDLRATAVKTEEFFCKHNANAIIAWGKLYRKDGFKGIRYPVGKIHEDEFTTYKILFSYENIVFVNQPLYFYYVNNESIMKSSWTPKRLAAFEAYKLQMDFFENNNLISAYRFKEKQYANLLWYYIQLCRETEGYAYYEKELKNQLRKYLLKHRKKGLTIKDNSWLYDFAFPRQMKYYWYWQVLKTKLKIS